MLARIFSGLTEDVRICYMKTESDRQRWDEFVHQCEDAHFFHLSGWEDVIDRAFGHRTYYLYAENSGEITGVLPLAQTRSRLFGNKLISLPFCVYGGVAALDDQSRAALTAAASDLAREISVDYLELRNVKEQTGYVSTDRYVTFRKRLSVNSEENMLAIPRKQRAMIRKGKKNSLEVQLGAQVDVFYAIYAESLRGLGTPVLSKRYFQILKSVFGESCDVLTIRHEGVPVSSVMSFYFRNEVLPYYGGGTPLARQYSAFDYMYWELMEDAVSRGVEVFDFGRSRNGTGSYRFKKHWGFEPEKLSYQYDLVNAKELPNLTPNNPKYLAAINIWKKLPLPVTNTVGPWLARNLG